MCLLSAMMAWSAQIQVQATDLADALPGEDLWQLDFLVSDRTFLQGEILDILFDPVLYTALVAGSASADWDVIILQQPDPGAVPPFNAGIYDALALIDNASLADPFSVQLVYLGAGSPAVQTFAFEIYDANFNLVESGVSTPPVSEVPEPSEWTVLLVCLAMLGTRLRPWRRNAAPR